MPVRDVDLDTYNKIRPKNSSVSSQGQSQVQISKEAPNSNKKFISISKR